MTVKESLISFTAVPPRLPQLLVGKARRPTRLFPSKSEGYPRAGRNMVSTLEQIRFNQLKQPSEFLSPLDLKEKNTIFDFYLLENTVNFLREQRKKGATDNELSAYLWREVERTMGEFAFQEKVARILYFLGNDGRLYPENVFQPAAEIYQKSAFGDREKAELFGFRKIEEMVASGKANLAFWLSPPSLKYPEHGNYGFLFVFVKKDRMIEEYVFRYQENKQTLEQSWAIYQKIFPETFSSKDFFEGEEANFFLSDPRFVNSSDPEKFMVDFLSKIGFGKINSYSETTKILREDLTFQELFRNFQLMVFSLVNANKELRGEDYYSLLAQAKTYFTRLYNRACDLVYERKITQEEFGQVQGKEARSSSPILPPPGLGDLDRKPLVLGGGSCPAIMTTNSRRQHLSSFGIVNYYSAEILTSASEEYQFDRKGVCIVCKQGPKLLGPCNICQECDKKMKK